MEKILRLIWFFILLSVSTTPVFSEQDELFYSGFKGIGAKDISLDGIAEIEKKGVLRLTNHTSRLIGHAFYPSPFQFKTSINGSAFSFTTSFAFAIVPEYTKLGGHGFAFTIAPSKELRGAHPSQYLGLLNATDVGKSFNHMVAVEFDTVQDFEFGDINDNHVGIDINSMASNASATAAYFTDDTIKHELNLKSGKTIKAWVDYDSVRNLLNVTVSPFSTKPRKPLLSFKIDLSPILLQSMYVGFSASTGLLASSHYLLGWSFKMNGEARNLDLSSLPSLPGPKKSNTALVVGVSTASATLLLVIAIFIAVYLIRKFKNRDVIEAWEIDIGPHRFSYKELKRATKGFRDKELIGFGGFGKVYKGTLPKSKTQVAVKRINHESKQGIREFVSEIATIGRLRHRNLVQLQGWCRRQSDLLLVYDYMANGSLDSYLFDDPKWILSWEQRFKIIKGVASGLLYLHEEWEQIVIHRDIKASNVLIDNELNGRLGDFGLARLCDHGANPSTTRVVGTLGYLAPELTRTGKGTTSSDVFAFGALLLEVVCGRRPIEPKAAPEELILVDWVWEKWREGLILDAVDSRLEGKFNEEEVLLVIKLGLMCSSHEPTVRPTMRQVVRYLEGEVKAPEVLNAPGQYETPSRHNEEAMADFLYSSYPSSFGGASAKSFNGYGDGDADTPPSRPRAGSPLSLPLW